MPRGNNATIENNFVNGLVTEATALTFPQNAVTETWNCIFDRIARVTRRGGFKFESLYETKVVDRTNKAFTYYTWRNVSGDGDETFQVIQIGDTLHFYQFTGSSNISSGELEATIDLTQFMPDGAPSPALNECQFSAGRGYLFVTHPTLNSFSVSYNFDTETFTTSEIILKIRDFEGVDDGLPIEQRPTATYASLSDSHKYNLLNQGWSVSRLTIWDNGRADMPSNADVMWTFKNQNDVFALSTVADVVRGNTPAPKGRFIVELYNQDRSAAAGMTLAIPNISTGYFRCSATAFFAGRIWYSGLNHQKYSSSLFFSQIIERDEQFGMCYQANDPTAEDKFDLLPTDGGVINIADAGTIIKMVPIGAEMFVWATNGIWSISGSQGIGFTANDYTVKKISSINAISASSFVDVSGLPAWWNLEGIYTIAQSQLGDFQVQPLSEGKIKTFYEEIPPSSRRQARGAFNIVDGVIQWLYRSEETTDLTKAVEFDRVLNYNITTGAFYPWSIPDTDVKINGVFITDKVGGIVEEEEITDNDLADVTDTDGNVYTTINLFSAESPAFKYIVTFPENSEQVITFATARNEDNVDWPEFGEDAPFDSYFISGVKLKGGGLTRFQSPQLIIYTDNNSHYTVTGSWDFSTSELSNRWTSPQTFSAVKSNRDTIAKKIKIRGSGRSLQFKVSAKDNLPFNIFGWVTFDQINQLP